MIRDVIFRIAAIFSILRMYWVSSFLFFYALKRYPSSPEKWLRAAYWLLRCGRYDDALECASAALERSRKKSRNKYKKKYTEVWRLVASRTENTGSDGVMFEAAGGIADRNVPKLIARCKRTKRDSVDVEGVLIGNKEMLPDTFDLILGEQFLSSVPVQQVITEYEKEPVFLVRFKLQLTLILLTQSDGKMIVLSSDMAKISLPISFFQFVILGQVSGQHLIDECRQQLHQGYLLNNKGRLARPKSADTAWVSDTGALFQKARSVFKQRWGYELYLTGGSLLGFARTGGVIDFDKDFDSGYLSNHTEPDALRNEFKNIILSLLRDGEDIRLVTRVGKKIRCDYFMWYDSSGAHIDVFPGCFIDGYYRRPTFVQTSLTREDFEPFKLAKFSGFEVTVPRNYEKKVAAVYGSGWRYPDPFWEKVKSPEMLEWRRSIMLTELDLLEIAAHSKAEGDFIKSAVQRGSLVVQY